MKRKINGFTLIELIVVVIIVAILGAVAIPKFVDLRSDADYAVFNSQFSAFESAVNLYHSVWLVKGHTTAIENLSGFGNNDVDSSDTGFPFAVSGSKTDIFYACKELWTGITNTSLTIAYVTDEDLATADVDIAYTYSPDHCIYRVLPFKQSGDKTFEMTYYFMTGKVNTKFREFSQ
ncbi:prepilin-type N-terminal cleavage/methylation domain-containing protein [Psychromonas hadalis]|uniref:prepilin-type N-terminal cleavage/methylation domain-containing protein n=1 Tax=Psychromonas hadalis TaxID=211669 RepID=UPI0003B464E8|nr:prepilin-type N-terminal cleavage/methylation domain-containing protein [Psychromonas hadalis]